MMLSCCRRNVNYVPLLNVTSAAPLSVVLSLLSQRKEGKRGRSVSPGECLLKDSQHLVSNKLLNNQNMSSLGLSDSVDFNVVQ